MKYSEIIIDPKLTKRDGFTSPNCVRLTEKPCPSLIVKNKNKNNKFYISCRDLCSLSWNIYQNSIFFQINFSLYASYCRDLNGGGSQRIEIYSNKDRSDNDLEFTAFFSQYFEDDWIYEADLFMDGRKDYHPTINRGKSKFGGVDARINKLDPDEILNWVNEGYLLWVDEISRISQPHSTLLEWVDSGLSMGVKCSTMYCRDEVKVIKNDDLKKFISYGATLEDLGKRLVCLKCGHRNPRIAPF